MQMLAPQVAKAKGFDVHDYRDVIRRLKRDTIPDDRLEPHYAEVNARARGDHPPRAHRHAAGASDGDAPGVGGRVGGAARRRTCSRRR